jgi:preprotein translocase SecE subunit
MAETVKNTETQERPSAPAPAAPEPGKGSLFPVAARLWVLLGALAWGTALAYLLSSWPAFGSEVAELSRAGAPLRGMALAAGGALSALLAWLGLLKFGGKLAWAKPGLGKWARGSALAGALAMAGFGAFSFYLVPPTTSLWWVTLWSGKLLGFALSLKPVLFPAAGILLAVGYGAYLFLNRERSADFLIETEGELRKVSWPARKEYLGSSVVVLIVVVVVSLFLTAVDHGLSWLMQVTKIGF